jgi:hypothetical protein
MVYDLIDSMACNRCSQQELEWRSMTGQLKLLCSSYSLLVSYDTPPQNK